MSSNRTRWLDKLRPAGASSGGWTKGPMAPVETTDAATVYQCCSFKHQTGGDTKLCVSLLMGQANLLRITNCRLCAGAMLSSRSIFQAARFVRVILEHGAMSSSQKTLICAHHPCASHTSVSFKKKTTQILNVILVQGPSSDIQSHTIFVQGPCSSVQKKKLCHPCAGAMQQCPSEDKASGSSRSSYLRPSIRGLHRFASDGGARVRERSITRLNLVLRNVHKNRASQGCKEMIVPAVKQKRWPNFQLLQKEQRH